MKKFLLVLGIVIVAAAAFVAGDQHGTKENGHADSFREESEHHSADSRIAATQEDAKISASFRCDDNSSFVADFTASMDEVTISSEGESNVFPKTASTTGKKYENAGWTFVFSGEGAKVTESATGKTKTCKQPVVPNKAAVNFGV